jgi:hypothetical protein
MEQEKIKYFEVMDLGFTESLENDDVYFQKFGFQYAIINKQLTPTISLDWEKETQLCRLIRIDNETDENIKKQVPVKNLSELTQIIDFFTD